MTIAFPHRRALESGFTLLEMVVNLGLLLVLMLVVGIIAGHTAKTVHSTSGKLAAVEKTETVRHTLARDLAAVVSLDKEESDIASSGSENSWKLELRIPGGSGWQEIDYQWEKRTGSLARWSTVDGKRVETVIGTGITQLEANWLESMSEDPETAPTQWSDGGTPPAAVRIRFETTRAREDGKRDKVREAHEKSSKSVFMLPVGGGGQSAL
jgi:hypothetical protein